MLGQGQEIVFTTADKLNVSDTSPASGEKGVSLYRTVQFNLEQEISTASVKISDAGEETGIPGRVEMSRGKVVFYPDYAFLPDTTYRAVLQAESKYHESLYEYELTFSTVDIDKKYWVEVKLGEKHTVTVYKGRERIRHMLASGGRPECPTPFGYFYTQDRGQSFWSYRFGEGATYWIRLVGQILVHSVPKDSSWKTKEKEHEKLGLPASHGCIRLDEKDAKWFFENIPRGTLVIIHR
ncbi:MAG: L,D-transpeptidase family protein [Bacillota bacterium]